MHKFFLIILISFIFLGSSCTVPRETPLTDEESLSVEAPESELDSPELPATVAEAVLQELSNQTGIAFDNLEITEATTQTWSDGCLELAQPDELCLQMLTEGWRILLFDGEKNWVYRTDAQGINLRLEE